MRCASVDGKCTCQQQQNLREKIIIFASFLARSETATDTAQASKNAKETLCQGCGKNALEALANANFRRKTRDPKNAFFAIFCGRIKPTLVTRVATAHPVFRFLKVSALSENRLIRASSMPSRPWHPGSRADPP